MNRLHVRSLQLFLAPSMLVLVVRMSVDATSKICSNAIAPHRDSHVVVQVPPCYVPDLILARPCNVSCNPFMTHPTASRSLGGEMDGDSLTPASH